eukprot:Rhum_TRINITY_DN13199_c0_g1::Rhum_TRINITY_DN13199_c0_g1_i1::g.57827::m.57827
MHSHHSSLFSPFFFFFVCRITGGRGGGTSTWRLSASTFFFLFYIVFIYLLRQVFAVCAVLALLLFSFFFFFFFFFFFPRFPGALFLRRQLCSSSPPEHRAVCLSPRPCGILQVDDLLDLALQPHLVALDERGRDGVRLQERAGHTRHDVDEAAPRDLPRVVQRLDLRLDEVDDPELVGVVRRRLLRGFAAGVAGGVRCCDRLLRDREGRLQADVLLRDLLRQPRVLLYAPAGAPLGTGQVPLAGQLRDVLATRAVFLHVAEDAQQLAELRLAVRRRRQVVVHPVRRRRQLRRRRRLDVQALRVQRAAHDDDVPHRVEDDLVLLLRVQDLRPRGRHLLGRVPHDGVPLLHPLVDLLPDVLRAVRGAALRDAGLHAGAEVRQLLDGDVQGLGGLRRLLLAALGFGALLRQLLVPPRPQQRRVLLQVHDLRLDHDLQQLLDGHLPDRLVQALLERPLRVRPLLAPVRRLPPQLVDAPRVRQVLPAHSEDVLLEAEELLFDLVHDLPVPVLQPREVLHLFVERVGQQAPVRVDRVDLLAQLRVVPLHLQVLLAQRLEALPRRLHLHVPPAHARLQRRPHLGRLRLLLLRLLDEPCQLVLQPAYLCLQRALLLLQRRQLRRPLQQQLLLLAPLLVDERPQVVDLRLQQPRVVPVPGRHARHQLRQRGRREVRRAQQLGLRLAHAADPVLVRRGARLGGALEQGTLPGEDDALRLAVDGVDPARLLRLRRRAAEEERTQLAVELLLHVLADALAQVRVVHGGQRLEVRHERVRVPVARRGHHRVDLSQQALRGAAADERVVRLDDGDVGALAEHGELVLHLHVEQLLDDAQLALQDAVGVVLQLVDLLARARLGLLLVLVQLEEAARLVASAAAIAVVVAHPPCSLGERRGERERERGGGQGDWVLCCPPSPLPFSFLPVSFSLCVLGVLGV